MSKLFDDASLAMIPSAYKDGKLYSIRPVPEYGAELVTNGGFDTDSDWNKNSNWTISGGTANCDGTNSNDLNQAQNTGVIGKSYKITFTITAISQGSIAVRIGSGATAYYTSVGTHSEIVTATTTDRIRVSLLGSAIASIDNVSVKEVLVNGDFTFSRGSNLAATRVDVNGLIEKGRENVLFPSNFSTGIAQTRCAIIGNANDPYGGTEAVKFVTSNDASTTHYINKTTIIAGIGQVMTMSVTAKANGYDFLRLEQGNNSAGATFELTGEGTIVSKNIAASIESIGNGWYRCSATMNTISTAFAWVLSFMPTSSISYTGDGVSGGFLYGAQLELGLVATDYIETGTSAAQSGILEDMPRLDYSGSCPSLLLEPQRTNLVEYSEYFAVGNWSTYLYGGASLARDFGYSSPEGKNNAYRFSYTAGSGGNGMLLTDNFIATASVDYTLSVWMKGAVGGEKVRLCLMDTGSNGVAGTTFTLTDEWVLYTDTITNSAGTSRGFQFRMQNVIGVDNDQVVYVYGAQAEQGSYPTSYIPTYGSSVTRSRENHQLNITSIIESSSFTWFFDLGDWVGSAGNAGTYELVNTGSTRIQLRVRSDGYRMYYQATNGGSSYPTSGSQSANKFCVAYDGFNYRLFIDGTLVNTYPSVGDTNWSFLMNAGGDGVNETLIIKQEMLFNTSLTDSECIALTTL